MRKTRIADNWSGDVNEAGSVYFNRYFKGTCVMS